MLPTPNQFSKDETILKPRTPTIKIEDVKKWFDGQTSIGFAAFNGDENSLFHTSPKWELASNRFSQIGTEFVVVPLKLELTGNPFVPRLLVRRLSNGDFVGRYVIYLPTIDYDERVQGHYNPLDFNGAVIYTDFNGNYINGYKIEEGIAVGPATATKDNGRSGSPISLRTCTFTTTCIDIPPVYVGPNQGSPMEQDCFTTVSCSGGGSGWTDSGGDPTGGGGGSGGSSAGSGGTWGGNNPNFGGDNPDWDTALNDAVFVRPTSRTIISDINTYLSCFTNVVNAAYKVTLCVEQPTPGTRYPYVDANGTHGLTANKNSINIGHTFLTIEQINPDGSKKVRNIGFYPKNGVTPMDPIVPGSLVNDENHNYDVGLAINFSTSDFFNLLSKIKDAGTPAYNLNDLNCTSYCVKRLLEIGTIIPQTNGSWPLGGGLNPGDLGQDIRWMNNLPLYMVIQPSGGISPLNQGN